MSSSLAAMLLSLFTPVTHAAGPPAVGSLVITEVMPNPRYVTPGHGEWFEITNVSSETVDLEGIEVSSSGAAGFTISGDLQLEAGGIAVLASDTNNAGLPRVDFSYDAARLPLANSGDDLTIGFEGVSLDIARFRGTWGRAAQLNPAALTSEANDARAAWCTPVSAYGSGNLGTPGQANDSCPASLADLVPGDIIVSELMIDPLATARGEWIEVLNLSDFRIDLRDLDIATSSDVVTIDQSVVLQPGDVAVIANHASANGGLGTVDWAADGRLSLDDTADEVLLSHAGIEFHRFAYDAGVDPVYAGTTLRVDSTMAADGRHEEATAWCITTEVYRGNDHGTPGESNGDCGIDADGDGVPLETDCNDGNAASHPWADEICDAEDNDCNGTVDDSALDVSTYWVDADTDGYGDPARPVQACTRPDSAAAQGGDCDDADATSNPGAQELCDGVDNDCDGEADESASDATTYYIDADNDGYGADTSALAACEAPAGYADRDGDCDDSRWSVRPGADEVCDTLDNDCDGTIDEDAVDGETFYADLHADGFGSDHASLRACSQPAGHVRAAGDCDDTTALAHPGANETCDTVDNDCDGETDEGVLTTWYADADGDRYGDPANSQEACSVPPGHVAVARDCDDTDASISPAATETCDRVDNDCTGVVDECGGNTFYADADGDGYGDPATGIDACFAPEGFVTDNNDCDDADANHFPGNAEVCDGVDNDCDGEADEGLDRTWYADRDADGFGDSGDSLVACAQPTGYILDHTDCDDTTALSYPGNTEVCDTLDNDCDRQIDE
ncbi:MAG: MopE-related protein, partial [Myxococcota bacterium]|nr:MopE-related protein [Myxococcota bacterium]